MNPDDDEPTEPLVAIYDRGPSSPWSKGRPWIPTPRFEDIDFAEAIESLTETQPLEYEE